MNCSDVIEGGNGREISETLVKCLIKTVSDDKISDLEYFKITIQSR